jgi:UDP-2-acetamido-3-amino-2,3-dideoxy-glucuronate N-acetyltransferase
MSTQDYFVHASAEIEDGAIIGAGSKVWRYAHVRTGARIGHGCTIGANVFIDAGVQIGHRVKIQNNVSVYVGVTIEDEVFVGPSAVFTNDLLPRAVNPYWQVTTTRVACGASIGANATIVCGRDIGEHAMVAAGAVVTKGVPAHQLVGGNPARPLGWVCACGRVISRGPVAPDRFSCSVCAAGSRGNGLA